MRISGGVGGWWNWDYLSKHRGIWKSTMSHCLFYNCKLLQAKSWVLEESSSCFLIATEVHHLFPRNLSWVTRRQHESIAGVDNTTIPTLESATVCYIPAHASLKNKTETIGKRWLRTAALFQYSQHFHLIWFLWHCPKNTFVLVSEDKVDFSSEIWGYPRLPTVVINKILEWKSLCPRSSVWGTDNCTFKKRTGLSANNKH